MRRIIKVALVEVLADHEYEPDSTALCACGWDTELDPGQYPGQSAHREHVAEVLAGLIA